MKCLKKIKKPMELYLHASSNIISMNSLNTIIANAMEKTKLGEASFYENDLFSSPSTEEKIYFDDTMPPIYDDYNDECNIINPPTIEDFFILIMICILFMMITMMVMIVLFPLLLVRRILLIWRVIIRLYACEA